MQTTEKTENALQLKNVNLPLGRVVMTRGIALAIGHGSENPGADEIANKVAMLGALTRHRYGDWGNVGQEDWESNNDALAFGQRILSSYLFPAADEGGESKFWIITEADRSVTTILFPSEY
jgi:hypothetical protein